MSRCCSDPGVETSLHQLVVVLPVPGVPRGRVALAAWHTLAEGGDAGEHQDPAHGRRHPACPVPDGLPRPLRRRAAGSTATHRANAGRSQGPARLEEVRRLVRSARPGGQLLPPDPAARALPAGRHHHRRDPLHLLQRERAARGHPRAVRQPPRVRVPVVFAAVRRGHLPADPCRGVRREDRPRPGGGEPAGVRHRDRAVVRAGARPPRPRPPLPPPRLRRPALSPRPTPDLPRDPWRRRPTAGAAAVRGLLRLPLPRDLAVVGPGPVAPVHHHPAPPGRQDPRHPRHPAGRGRDRAIRQGRRVPAPRGCALPRPGSPRRPQDPRRVRTSTRQHGRHHARGPGRPCRRVGTAHRARRR